MHTIIAAIVYANNESNALAQARQVFARLVQEHAFDDYTLLHDRTKAAVPSNWSKYPTVAKANSSEGKRFITDRWQATKRRFDWAIGNVREAVTQYTDDELFAGKDDLGGVKQLFRYSCLVIGRMPGPDVFLYDNEAEGICTKEHLEHVLNKWPDVDDNLGEQYPLQNVDVWIVSGYTHC
ncbi:MAG: hypothetical protein M3261_04500 [Thermoproteota archaeon]|nr:hypothetical protein [Thermoproteota archaeon]